MMKIHAVLAIILLSGFSLFGQRPEIVSLNKYSGANHDLITINGNNFGTNAAVVKVFFGAAEGDIKNIADQLIEVYVPAGATFDNIRVLNTTTGLSAYTPEKFSYVFNGETGLAPTNFSTQSDLLAESGLYDLCLCDFNSDGKTDIATASDNSSSISFYQNGSVAGSISLTRTSKLLNAKTLHVTCGDLNGDGRPEVIASEGGDGDRIYIFKNNGSFTFAAPTFIKLTGRKVKRIAVADLDLDGRPELVITDKAVTDTPTIAILGNQSTTSTISFATAVNIPFTGGKSSDALEIQDLNNDGLPEIITSQFLTDNSGVFILINKSTTGIFNFNDQKSLVLNQNVVNLKVGDLDGDGKPDIAATRLLASDITVLQNTTTGASLSFADATSITTNIRPWGLDFGDLDGDGKTDIAIASIESKSITVLNNQSTPGNIAFATLLTVPTTFINRHVRLGDMDGDGKPDIAFTSIDDNKNGVPSSKISVIRNASCLVPKLTPSATQIICAGRDLKLFATPSSGATYSWKNGATQVSSGPDAFFDVTTTGDYTVTATSEGVTCTKISNSVTVTVSGSGAGLTGAPNARSNSPVCTGNTLTLQTDDVGATNYRWIGPDGFTQTTSTPAPLNVTTDFTIDKTGVYVLELIVNSCVSLRDTTIVQGISVPEFKVSFSGDDKVCDGQSKILSVSPPVSAGFSFQWFNAGGEISGQTSSSLSISQGDEYFVKVISSHPGCSPVDTDHITIGKVTPPQATFSIPAQICQGTATSITNSSIVDSNADVVYTWTMAAGDVVTGQNPAHTYSSAGAKTPTLVVSYTGVPGCIDSDTQNTTVVAVIAPVISPSSTVSLCPGDTVTLSIQDNYKSVAWSNGAETNVVKITASGDYTVTATDNNDCPAIATKTVQAKLAPVITASAPKEVISLGESITLTATGGSTYLWTPAASLNDATSATPTATPTESTTYIVKGTSSISNCWALDSVKIIVTGQSIVVRPDPAFSPDHNGSNELWTIYGIENYPDCTLNIFDGRGSRVYEKKGYANEWDARINGADLPEGVYYYVLGCPSVGTVTGSVVVIR
jgi:gliding motility-associated-like protein